MIVVGRIVGMSMKGRVEVFLHAMGMAGGLDHFGMALKCLEGRGRVRGSGQDRPCKKGHAKKRGKRSLSQSPQGGSHRSGLLVARVARRGTILFYPPRGDTAFL